jgi:hypothetical protein
MCRQIPLLPAHCRLDLVIDSTNRDNILRQGCKIKPSRQQIVMGRWIMDTGLVLRCVFRENMGLVFMGVTLFWSTGTLVADPQNPLKGFKP